MQQRKNEWLIFGRFANRLTDRFFQMVYKGGNRLPIKKMNKRERQAYMSYVRSFRRKKAVTGRGRFGNFFKKVVSTAKDVIPKAVQFAKDTGVISKGLKMSDNEKLQALSKRAESLGFGRIRARF